VPVTVPTVLVMVSASEVTYKTAAERGDMVLLVNCPKLWVMAMSAATVYSDCLSTTMLLPC
jgi:hypothetical protein